MLLASVCQIFMDFGLKAILSSAVAMNCKVITQSFPFLLWISIGSSLLTPPSKETLLLSFYDDDSKDDYL